MRVRESCCLVGFLCATVFAGVQEIKPPMCQQVKFSGHVEHGKDYRQTLGADLTFVLQPTNTGWQMEIEGLSPEHPETPGNYLTIATPPYHFNDTASIDDSYGRKLEDAIKESPREFHFALDAAQFEKIGEIVEVALHGGDRSAAEQDRATDFVLNRMAEVTGSGKFSINRSQIGKLKGEKKDAILSLDFSVELRVPESFEPSREVAADRGGCPR